LITTHHDGAAKLFKMLFDGVKVFAKLLTGTDVNDFARDVEQFVNDQANLGNNKILEEEKGKSVMREGNLYLEASDPITRTFESSWFVFHVDEHGLNLRNGRHLIIAGRFLL
jgi:hypothetical protein